MRAWRRIEREVARATCKKCGHVCQPRYERMFDRLVWECVCGFSWVTPPNDAEGGE